MVIIFFVVIYKNENIQEMIGKAAGSQMKMTKNITERKDKVHLNGRIASSNFIPQTQYTYHT